MRLSDDQIAAIALSTIPGLGPARLKALSRHLGSRRRALRVSAQILQEVPGIGATLAREIASLDARLEVGRQLRLARNASAFMVTEDATAYPPLLLEIHDPPAFLWARGSRRVDLRRAVAIVGSRRATRYGTETAFAFARDLVERGYTVVSGLAYGIDAAAHRGALDAGGVTVAVLGSGVDTIYPGANRSLFYRILESGAAFSEFPMGAKPDATNFPRRNRLISGMCLGVVVVEAYEEGGGLITAKFALDQNREVFCVPGPITSSSSTGTNRMIRDGQAKLVTKVEDVIDEFPPSPSQPSPQRSAGAELTDSEQRLVEAINDQGTDLDTISVRSGMTSADALVALLTLEMKGVVRQGVGGVFYLVNFTRKG